MRVRVDYRSASKENYIRFIAQNPHIQVTYNEWLEIIYTFNEEFRDHILETGDKERLPFGLGPVSIVKKKRKMKKVSPDGKEYINLPIDWKRTKEKGKVIYNFNSHTEGYFFGWIWFKSQARIKFSTLWRFKPTRVSSRMIAHYLKTNSKYQHIYKQWKKG